MTLPQMQTDLYIWRKPENKTSVLNPSSCLTFAVVLHVQTPRLVKGECFATWLGCFSRVRDMSCGGVDLKGKGREQTAATNAFSISHREQRQHRKPWMNWKELVLFTSHTLVFQLLMISVDVNIISSASWCV